MNAGRRIASIVMIMGLFVVPGLSWAMSPLPATESVVADSTTIANDIVVDSTVATPVSHESWVQLDLNKAVIAEQSVSHLRQRISLQPGFDLSAVKTSVDRFGHTQTRVQLKYKGVPVANAGVSVHTDLDGNETQTGELPDVPPLDTTPTISPDQAKEYIQQAFTPAYVGLDKIRPRLKIKLITELSLKEGVVDVETASATEYEDKITGSRLIYRASVFTTDSSGPHRYVIEIDAHSGEVLLLYDGLDRDKALSSDTFSSSATTTDASTKKHLTFDPVGDTNMKVGNAHSQYSGLVTVPVTDLGDIIGKYYLGKSVYKGTPDKGEEVFLIDIRNFEGNDQLEYIDHEDVPQFSSDESNTVWGNGANYTKDDLATSDPATSAHAQTAAVDVLYGAMVTWDLWQNVFNHIGLDGVGNDTFIAGIHVGTEGSSFENNAYFDDGTAYFPDAEPDGKQLTQPDIVGHELAHGLFRLIWEYDFDDADWDNYGEQGGVNEANSDIMGTLVEFYETLYPNNTGNTIPAAGGNWTIGEKTQPVGAPVRYMYKPSKDGVSYDAWFPGINDVTVKKHYSSGVMNRMFYFLSEGVQPSWGDPDYTSDYLAEGMSGIGIHKAGKIWHLALTKYLVPGFNFASMRYACELAAEDLYDKFSVEYKAVQDAFAAVNVGPPAERTPPLITLSTSGPRSSRTLHVNLSDASGAQGGTISVTAKNAYGLETNVGSAFIGDSGSLYLGNMRQHVFRVRVTAKDTDDNESHQTRWFDYETPAIEEIKCTGGRISHEVWQHYADVRTCSVTVTDAVSINRLEFEVPNDVSGVVYRYSWQMPVGDGGVAWTGADTVCDTGCASSDWPAPVAHTFEFEADLSNIMAPGGRYDVKVTAFDNAGNTTNTKRVSVIVDEWPPEIGPGILGYSEDVGAYTGELDLLATVFDGGGHVDVTFYIDGAPVCEVSGEGYSYDLFQPSCQYDSTVLSNAAHTYSVTAIDRWDQASTKSINFNVNNSGESEQCTQTTLFAETEPNGAGNPDLVPPCTGTVRGFWHSVSTYPADFDYYKYRLEPGQSIVFSGGWNCTFDIDTLRQVHTNDTTSAVDFNFLIKTYSDTCSFGSYELTMNVINPLINLTSSTSITGLPAELPDDVSGSALRAWISSGSNSITIEATPAPLTLD